MTIYYETPILENKHQVRRGLPTNMRRSVRTDNKNSPGKNTPHLSPPSHQPWFKLGSLLALSGYISQLACQFLIVSSLCLAYPGSLEATETDFDSPYSNPAYHYTDEDIQSCINAAIFHSTEIERVPNNTYLLKPKGGDSVAFIQGDETYYTALLPSCSCIAGTRERDVTIPALPVTYYLNKSNQSNEFGDLLTQLLQYENTVSMTACIEARQKETKGNYDGFMAIIKGTGGEQEKEITQIRHELKSRLPGYKRLTKDVFDELLLQTSSLDKACYRMVFPFCRSNVHWYVGEIKGEKRGINNYKFTVVAHNPYGGGDFREEFSEDAVEIRESLSNRLVQCQIDIV